MNFSNAMLSEITAFVNSDKMTYQKAADRWLNNNQKLWRSWIPPTCQKFR
ncbi:hypothetical protein [Psychromonas sp. Urea-02u-13]|nr:hypothetical protein [Psychromonas sp. Urea-02u-13]